MKKSRLAVWRYMWATRVNLLHSFSYETLCRLYAAQDSRAYIPVKVEALANGDPAGLEAARGWVIASILEMFFCGKTSH